MKRENEGCFLWMFKNGKAKKTMKNEEKKARIKESPNFLFFSDSFIFSNITFRSVWFLNLILNLNHDS